MQKGKKGGDLDDGTVAYNPEEGAVSLLVHGDHCLEHEAEHVLNAVKYGMNLCIGFSFTFYDHV